MIKFNDSIRKLVILFDIFYFVSLAYFVAPFFTIISTYVIHSILSFGGILKITTTFGNSLGFWLFLTLPLSIFILYKIHVPIFTKSEIQKGAVLSAEAFFILVLIHSVSESAPLILLFNWEAGDTYMLFSVCIFYSSLIAFIVQLFRWHRRIFNFVFKPIILAGVLILILFSAPWMGEDGGEDVIRKIQSERSVQEELDLLKVELYIESDEPICDGLSTRWAPFGRYVDYCEYASWYVPFWKM